MDYKLNYVYHQKDERDFQHLSKLEHTAFPPALTLKNSMPPILNQLTIGSCVANGLSLAISYINKDIILSRLYLYFNSRAVAHLSLDDDTGVSIRDSCIAISKYGICSEATWMYDITKFANLPPLVAYNKQITLNNYIYLAVSQDLNSIKKCINEKYPIVFGFNVYDNFFTPQVANTGIVSLPDLNKNVLQGSHCVVLVGYDDNTNLFECANSWGTGWGNSGYFYLPYNYVTNSNLANDFWTIRYSVNIPPPVPTPIAKPIAKPIPTPVVANNNNNRKAPNPLIRRR